MVSVHAASLSLSLSFLFSSMALSLSRSLSLIISLTASLHFTPDGRVFSQLTSAEAFVWMFSVDAHVGLLASLLVCVCVCVPVLFISSCPSAPALMLSFTNSTCVSVKSTEFMLEIILHTSDGGVHADPAGRCLLLFFLHKFNGFCIAFIADVIVFWFQFGITNVQIKICFDEKVNG